MIHCESTSFESAPLRIVDISGKTMYEQSVNSGSKLDISTLDPGFYMVQIENKVQKLIVK